MAKKEQQMAATSGIFTVLEKPSDDQLIEAFETIEWAIKLSDLDLKRQSINLSLLSDLKAKVTLG